MIEDQVVFDSINTFNQLTQIPLRNKSRAEALNAIVRLGKEALGSQICTLVFIDRKNKTLTHAACAGVPQRFETFLIDHKIKMGTSENQYFEDSELLSEGKGGERYNLQKDGQDIVKPKVARRYGFNSVLSEPLVSEEDGFIGYFNHFSPRNTPFTARERKLAKIFSNQALLTIERFDYLQLLDQSLNILSDLSQSLLSDPPEEFLTQIPVKAADLLRVPVCIVWKLNKDTNELEIIAATENVNSDYRTLKLHRGDPGIRIHLARRTASYLRDIALADSKHFQHVAAARDRGWRSLLSIPMWSENELVGMIDVFTDYEREFKEREKRFFESFANQAALSIQKSDLLREKEILTIKRQLRKKEAIINEVQTGVADFTDNDKVPSGEQLPEVLNLIVERCASVMNADVCFIHLWNKSNDILKLRSQYPSEAALCKLSDFRIGEGIIGGVAQEGKSDKYDDVVNELKCSSLQHVSNISSILCVPLKSGDAVIGTISVGSNRLGAFGQDEQQLLEGIADSLLNVIGRTNLSDNLLKLAKASHEADCLESLCQRLAELTSDLMWEPVAVVWIIDKDKNGFAIHGLVTPEEQKVDRNDLTISMKTSGANDGGEDPIGRFLERNTPLFLKDAVGHKEHPYRDKLAGLEWKSVLTMPLVVKNRAIGLLEVYSYKKKRTFTGSHQKLFGSWVTQASIAIGNVRARTRLQVLSKVSHRMAETNNLDDLLSMTLESAFELVRTKKGWISLLDPGTGKLEIRTDSKDLQERRGLEVGEGITGKALEDECSILADDVSDPKYKDIYVPLLPETVSELAVPIVLKKTQAMVGDKTEPRTKLIGVINIESPTESAFYEADQESLEALAQMAAVMIERIEIDRKLRDLTEIETRIVGAPFDETIRKVTDGIKETLGYDYVNLSLVIPEMNLIRTEYVTGIPDKQHKEFDALAKHKLDSKNSDLQAFVYREKTILVPDENDARFDQSFYEKFDLKNMLVVFIPMVNPANERVIGTVEAGYRKTKYRKYIYEQDVQILQRFLNYAVQAMVNRDRDRIQVICHEFRAPTVGIKGNSSFLQRRLPELPADLVERKFQDIEMDCELIFNQVDELEYVLTGVPPSHKPKPTLVMRDIVIKTVKQLRPKIIDHGLDFTKVEYSTNDIARLGTFVVDTQRLNQVVFNLLMNSIKYAEQDPKLFTIRILVDTTPQAYLLIFKDWGIGIPIDCKERVFERGFRTDEAKRIDVTGSGLGLTLAREIMRGMDGDLILKSPRKPTEFHVFLPKHLRENPK